VARVGRVRAALVAATAAAVVRMLAIFDEQNRAVVAFVAVQTALHKRLDALLVRHLQLARKLVDGWVGACGPRIVGQFPSLAQAAELRQAERERALFVRRRPPPVERAS